MFVSQQSGHCLLRIFQASLLSLIKLLLSATARPLFVYLLHVVSKALVSSRILVECGSISLLDSFIVMLGKLFVFRGVATAEPEAADNETNDGQNDDHNHNHQVDVDEAATLDLVSIGELSSLDLLSPHLGGDVLAPGKFVA